MLGTLLLVTALTPLPVQSDTVFELRRGDRVVIENLSGEVSVEAWNRDRIEVRGDQARTAFTVGRSGSDVRVEVRDGRRGRRRSADATIRLPAWVDLTIGGPDLELSVVGLEGSLDVRNVSGEVRVRDIGGPVEVRSIDGEILVEDARAGVRASSQSDDVTLRRVSGPVDVHSGSGDLLLLDVESESLRAETQDGDIDFSGTIADGGEYGFYVHDGDALIAVPRSTNAHVSVSTFDGEFESEFPVVVERFTAGREFEFDIGDGSARLEIQVFDGEIRLLERR